MKISNIKNAFENIKNACDTKIAKLYPINVPKEIISRYEDELVYLKESEYQDDFEIFRRLSDEAVKCSTVISMCGTEMGSFIYYLLGNNCFNPLPAHYYCSECGYYETIQTHLFGIDLPEKSCPNCGKSIFADGFNLPLESVWGNDGKKSLSFEYRISEEFLPFARRVLLSIYPENCIVPWGIFQCESIPPNYPDDRPVGVGLSGYAIFPTGNTIEDYPDLISYLENGDSCVIGSGWELRNNHLKPIRLFPLENIDYLIELQRATGVYANDITIKELRNITWSNIYNTTILDSITSSFFYELKPKTYRDMVAIESSSHSTFSWQDDVYKDIYAYNKMISSDAFKQYPCFTREDFFDYLLEAGLERSFAFDISEQIRKGKANDTCKFSDEFNALPIPEAIKEVARNYLYIFPRAHCIEFMLMCARLAYYAKIDSRAFSKIVYEKNH